MASLQQNEWVQRVLGVTVGGPAEPNGAADHAATLEKARKAWEATRARLGAEVDKLKHSILEATRDSEDFAAVQAGIGVLDDPMRTLDERLIQKLKEVDACAVPAKRPRLLGEARLVVNEYATFVATDPLMRRIDNNGFETVAVSSQAKATLKALSAALK